MTSGLPDYYRGIRPRFGGGEQTTREQEVAANESTVLATISGKGMVYGGVILFDYTSTQKNSIPVLAVDGKKLCAIKYATLNKYNIQGGGKYPVILTIYDEVNFIYGVAFSYGITFESELGISYIELHGTTPTVYCNIIYALI